ncbi:DUF5786 family protein [Haloglomus litoreum]|uniref:DUF5786 family protein n=1 Tax=Haloglomus litoreum TaxID=3034026 RepID=UPI0023E78E2F|nr:DUF5786 family protein [Haloglomus sp. DT116]
MGFGSYDESEQENQEIDTDFEDEEGMNTAEHDHRGDVNYEFGDTDSDELLNKLKDIKDQQEEQGS